MDLAAGAASGRPGVGRPAERLSAGRAEREQCLQGPLLALLVNVLRDFLLQAPRRMALRTDSSSKAFFEVRFRVLWNAGLGWSCRQAPPIDTS